MGILRIPAYTLDYTTDCRSLLTLLHSLTLCVGRLQESLSEKAQQDQLSSSEKLKRFGVHLGTWLLSTGLAVGASAAIYFLSEFEQKVPVHPKELAGRRSVTALKERSY